MLPQPEKMDVSAETVTTTYGVTATDHMSSQAGHYDPPQRLRHHGLALFPPPSNDPRDPLRWPRWTKIAALFVSAMTNFTANFAGAGLSVAVPVLEAQYQRSANDINALLTVCFLIEEPSQTLNALDSRIRCLTVQLPPSWRR